MTSIHQQTRTAALNTASRRPRATAEQRAELSAVVVRRYTDHASIRTIAREIDRSYGFVHRLLDEAGVPRRPCGNPPKPAVGSRDQPTARTQRLPGRAPFTCDAVPATGAPSGTAQAGHR